MSPLVSQTLLILRNDLRINWREFRSGRLSVGLIVIGLLLILGHVIAFLVFLRLKQPPPIALEAFGWAFFGLIMLSAAMTQSIGLLYERADFDLLLSSPVQPRAVLAARMLSLGAGAAVTVAPFLLPVLNGAIFGLSPHYAAGYLVWLLLAALAASLGVWMALGLVRWIGVRRARIVAQVAAALFGASLYLGLQLPNLLPREFKRGTSERLQAVAGSVWFAAPARAARGEGVPLATLIALAGACVALTTRQMARTFISGTQDATVVAAPSRRAGRGSPQRWTEGLARATVRKEIRLILRDPLLIAQILPSALYILPALFSFGRQGGWLLLAPVMVVTATQFSSMLTAVAAAGEEGWDLIRMSPAHDLTLRLAKMAAGLVVPVAFSAIIGLVLAIAGHPWLALTGLLIGASTASAAAWLQVTDIEPVARKDLFKRRAQRSKLRGVITVLLMMSAAAGMGIAAQGSLWIGVVVLGVSQLGVIACFTFASIKPIHFEPSSA
ncbi:MAG: hypothetical protein JNJ82_00045 [Opitutaceae bacterium]|jgi:ABC-2 type transport system permease protein|nr:hypothetical protein [Opitutaceae bacterium]